VLEELKRAFRPEFINRIDEVIVFHALSEADIKAIVRLMINRVNKQLEEKAIRIELTLEAEELLLQKGYDATYGARQLRRTIQKHIEDPLAEAIVSGQIQEGSRIEVRPDGENFAFEPINELTEPSLNLAER
jgi:ATP-dependent Clp protease ATP-binding subunit ClpC